MEKATAGFIAEVRKTGWGTELLSTTMYCWYDGQNSGAVKCARLENHQEGETSSLSDNQYGFRRKRATIDTIKRLTDISEKAIESSRWIDGCTFNSLPLMSKTHLVLPTDPKY